MSEFGGDNDHKSKVIVDDKGPNDQDQGYPCHKSLKQHKMN